MRSMGFWRGRLSRRRLVLAGALLAVAVGLVAIGDPTDHAAAGTQATGERSISEVPPVAWYVGLATALVLLAPARRASG